MSNVSIPAHFDGERILLDEPVALEPNTKLIVTVSGKNDAEHESWMRLSGLGLETAYGTDEEECSLDSIREANPEYDEGRRRNLTPVPQADGTIKTRPAVILRESHPTRIFSSVA